MTWLTVGTRNQQGRGSAEASDGDIVGYTESSGQIPTNHAAWRPRKNRRLSFSWRPAVLKVEEHGYRHAYYGIPLFTPNTGAAWIAGRIDDHQVAVVVTHLMNNAFGPDLRGRRRLRRRLWTKGLNVALEVVHELRDKGYLVFLVGDFNRHQRGFVPGMVDAAGTQGMTPYDRVFYPRASTGRMARQRWVKRGRRLGSDHMPYTVAFRLEAAK